MVYKQPASFLDGTKLENPADAYIDVCKIASAAIQDRLKHRPLDKRRGFDKEVATRLETLEESFGILKRSTKRERETAEYVGLARATVIGYISAVNFVAGYNGKPTERNFSDKANFISEVGKVSFRLESMFD